MVMLITKFLQAICIHAKAVMINLLYPDIAILHKEFTGAMSNNYHTVLHFVHFHRRRL